MFCSKKLRLHLNNLNANQKGQNNRHWKDGSEIRFGYKFVRTQEHPFRNARDYILEHRLVMEKHLGRYLLPQEVVHHLDGNRLNNTIENLYLFSSKSEHRKYHGFLKKLLIDFFRIQWTKLCVGCGAIINNQRLYKKFTWEKINYCSKSCATANNR